MTAAARAEFLGLGNVVLDAHARQRIRQRFAVALDPLVFGDSDLGGLGSCRVGDAAACASALSQKNFR